MTEAIRVIIDQRELRSGIVREFEKLNIEYSLDTLTVGDYLLSDRCCAERKKIEDLLKSWIEDRKLFSQLIDLTKSYARPLLFIEGVPEELYTSRRINPKAIEGVLVAITVSLRIPIIWTLNTAETASWMVHIAEKEQNTEDKKYFSQHGKRSHLSPTEQLIYTVSSIQNTGDVTARNLLSYFNNIQNIANADIQHLKEVELVGEKTASALYEFFRREYKR